MYILISIFRWVEGEPVADCLSCFVKVVEFWKKFPKSKRPACKSYPPLVEAVQEPLAAGKLEFFSFLQVSFSFFFLLIKLRTQWYGFCIKIFLNSLGKFCF